MNIKRICKIGVLTAIIAVCAWITVPGPVPFTLQTFAVFFAAMVLGAFDGFISVAVYVLLGAVGLPIFSGFRGGIGVLLGATGGYIVGFLLIPLIMLIFEKRGRVAQILSYTLGLLVCYAFGTAWFAVVYVNGGKEFSVIGILTACVLPFILPDIIKIALAYFISGRIKKAINH